MDAAAFQALTDVSRETLEKLQAYADLLQRWQARINLVGPGTVADLWRRHMLDSAQLYPLIPPGARRLVDLGSGAGFPGLVLSVLGVGEVHLVERDSRKAVFLREAIRATGATARVHATDIERFVPAQPPEVITARALAPLAVLSRHADRLGDDRTVCLFLKGRSVGEELEALAGRPVDLIPSRSDPEGVVVRIGGRLHA